MRRLRPSVLFLWGPGFESLEASGGYFHHANVRMPRWLRYFIQTATRYSAYHEIDLHTYNFADIRGSMFATKCMP